MIRKATCCCGSSGIETEGNPVFHTVCHCNDCKKRTGSAFGISAYFQDDQIISKFGATGIYEINNEYHQERHFCTKCGTTLYWNVSVAPGKTGIAGGCFDDPLPEPDHTVSNESKCAWVGLPESWKQSANKEDIK